MTQTNSNETNTETSVESKDQSETTSKVASLKSTNDKKAPGAFRTIREVAELLDVQQHVLRFWETKFNQVKPLKRGGGRRYYRPEDVVLLQHVHHLLYTEGYTIKGVQKLFKGQTKNQIVAELASGEANAKSSSSETSKDTQSASPSTAVAGTQETASNSGLSQKQRSILEAMLGELKDARSIIKS